MDQVRCRLKVLLVFRVDDFKFPATPDRRTGQVRRDGRNFFLPVGPVQQTFRPVSHVFRVNICFRSPGPNRTLPGDHSRAREETGRATEQVSGVYEVQDTYQQTVADVVTSSANPSLS